MSWFNFNSKYHDELPISREHLPPAVQNELPIVSEYSSPTVHHELPSCEYMYDLNSLPATSGSTLGTSTLHFAPMPTTSGAASVTSSPHFVTMAYNAATTCVPKFESVPPDKHTRFNDAATSGATFSTSIAHKLLQEDDTARCETTLSTSFPQFAPVTPYKPMRVNDNGTADATLSTSIPHFAPVTPDKGQVFDVQKFQVDNRRDPEGEWQHKEVFTTTNTNGNNDKDLTGLVQSSLPADLQTMLQEIPDKEDGQDIDLNTTPLQKQRRKKHRPKVVIEGKPKRTPKSGTPKTENPTGKRKYVRKNVPNKAEKTPPSEAGGDCTDLKTLEPTKKSCRRALNFETEAQHKDEHCAYGSTVGSETQTNHCCPNEVEVVSTVQPSSRIEMEGGRIEDISSVSVHPRNGTFIPESEIPRMHPLETSSLQKGNDFQEKITEIQMTAHTQQEKTNQLMLNISIQPHAISPNYSNCSTSVQLRTEEDQAKEPKRKYYSAVKQTDSSRSRNLAGAQHNNMQQYQMTWMQLPNICKKKRTTKGQNHTTLSTSCCRTEVTDAGMELPTCLQNENFANPFRSQTCCWLSGPHLSGNKDSPAMAEARNNLQDKHQSFKYMRALRQHKRTTKKTSKTFAGICGLSSLTGMSECNLPPIYSTKHSSQNGNEQRFHTCIDALIADMQVIPTRKSRTKRNNSLSVQNSALCNKRSSFKSEGTPSGARRKIFSVDTITKQLHYLDINRESSKFTYQERNAIVPYNNIQKQESNMLVLYRRDGAIVPFEGSFDPIKRRRPRPRVDLDDETNRVWRLLLENINSEGIDGTDEEKTKWWEEERRVFQGRADSFIARMHLVQGDRRFSPWKGSVVDSVVGVFLTQNVSDHLSSSAFMSLVARFPFNSMGSNNASSVSNEPEVCIMEKIPHQCIMEKIQHQPFSNKSSVALQGAECNEFKDINNSESSRSNTEGVSSTNESEYNLPSSSETRVEMYHSPLASRISTNVSRIVADCDLERQGNAICDIISSQNSADSSASQTADRFASCSESNSEVEDFPNRFKNDILDKSTSFTELLWNITRIGQISPYDNLKNKYTQPKSMENGNKVQVSDAEGPKNFLPGSMDPLNDFYLHQATSVEASALECSDIFREDTQSVYNAKNKDESSGSIESTLTVESASQDTIQNIQETPRSPGGSCNNILGDKNKGIESQSIAVGKTKDKDVEPSNWKKNQIVQPNFPKLSAETLHARQNAVESGIDGHSQSLSKNFGEMNAATTNPKSRQVRKDKKDEFDWDKLRNKAEANGKKREKTANTMDSLDWDAVRCADVKEIADAIRERGMNNMLAERIKDFLNRLVTEHGSVDLEWLRDVPPDQAKEYLLSFRGLGLKSVECVRLLTLHHLAFPVDTNVGRIAVRLGWVPLQPLPESLQLHLLELYPVLESIQKYLWPRLCKLDQRTLYELHYQMITFGKVFCTKSKPNCNACPMRGECRHFASAFASARLALPGPEEKSIVSTTGYTKQDVNSTVINDRSPLLLPQPTSQSAVQTFETNQQPVAIAQVNHCEPIIEEPASPEPQYTQISLKDIEDSFYEDPEEIPTIKLNIEEFSQNVQNYMQENMQLQESEVSKALVALTSEAASLPIPKLKNVNQLRTEHYVYELPDSHPLLDMLQTEKREPDDPCPYLLAIWTPGETPNSIQPPEKKCSSQEFGELCNEKECFSCNSVREANSQTVRGTILIPCRTAMRGSFPLNGTYFQVNEVFADHDSSLNPIDVPRNWIWNLTRRTVYFGTSIPSIFKGLSTQSIQQCFWRGFVCVRGFDRKSRAPRPLIARLHFPASKLAKAKERKDE